MRQHWTGADAWRNGFSVNAADLLQLYRVFAPMSDDEFKHALVECAKRSRGRQTNERTVGQVLQAINDARKAEDTKENR